MTFIFGKLPLLYPYRESDFERNSLNFQLETVSCQARHKYSHENYQQLALKTEWGRRNFPPETIACERTRPNRRNTAVELMTHTTRMPVFCSAPSIKRVEASENTKIHYFIFKCPLCRSLCFSIVFPVFLADWFMDLNATGASALGNGLKSDKRLGGTHPLFLFLNWLEHKAMCNLHNAIIRALPTKLC